MGGTGTVPRESGQTLRTEYAAAVDSSPDMLGLISWNEFSENSYIEPSKEFGYFYLDAVADLRGATVPAGLQAMDSSSPGAAADSGYWPDALLLAGFALLFAGAVGGLSAAARSRRRAGDGTDGAAGGTGGGKVEPPGRGQAGRPRFGE